LGINSYLISTTKREFKDDKTFIIRKIPNREREIDSMRTYYVG